ncbi:MAG: TlpA disulfide reductase family protein [Vicinamibacterales bacterium]
MRRMAVTRMTAGLVVLLLAGTTAQAQSLSGLWDATVGVNKMEVPFRMELSSDGTNAKGSFFNGDERVTSSSGRLENGALALTFDEYGTKLEATLKDGVLEGQYVLASKATYPFRARRFEAATDSAASVPAIGGLWNVQVKSNKGESAWTLIVRQSGAEVSAAMLRVDGDTGTLSGRYANGKFTLSHFSGARPSLFEITPVGDGTLEVVQNGQMKLVGVRADDARAKDLPQPTDPSRFTSVKDPSEPFKFSFPDLGGAIVANTDPRFRGKALIVSISGSWCPNCHDEAPFLVELYKKYKDRGLEIVSLSFEEGEQGKNPVRLRAFMKRYGIDYTVLLAGEPKEASTILSQTVNLNAFPTTFFIGRDGLVRGVHAGFASAAAGAFHQQTKDEIIERVEHMLGENSSAR